MAQLENVGTARLSTPELLSKKISAVTGVPWSRGYDRADFLRSDYRILYGGIDSDNVTQRLSSPNGVMAAVQWRMANEVACAATAWDFKQAQDQRFMFRHVTQEDTPTNSAEAIRRNIQFLHANLLGEDLELDDEEVTRTFDLLRETYEEGIAKVASDELSKNIDYSCRARRNPWTGEDLPEGEILQGDENYVVRSWMAVVTYLLADYKFLYE
jgi:hypothetical protein